MKIKKIGYRGHNILDWICYISIIVCLIGLIINCTCIQKENSCLPVFDCRDVFYSLIILIVVTSVLFVIYYDSLLKFFDFHVNPTKPDIEDAIDNAKKYVPIISDDC